MKIEIVKSNKKVELGKSLIDELDDLYDDLAYNKDFKDELNCIKSKIKIREQVLTQLGSL